MDVSTAKMTDGRRMKYQHGKLVKC